MESIRILQDTYEKLYAITPVLGNFLENEFKQLSSLQWRENYVEPFLQEKNYFNDDWMHLREIDIYYLLTLLKKYWNLLAKRKKSTFFTKENQRLFIVKNNNNSILSIRDKVAHPEYWNYTMETYNNWKKSLENAAEALNESMPELLWNMHKDERQKLLDIILNRVVNPALKSDKVPEDLIPHIKSTKARLEMQNTAAGIIAFFTDALRSETGKKIDDFFRNHKMESFETIKNDVINAYYGV